MAQVEKFGVQLWVQVRDFVQEECPALGCIRASRIWIRGPLEKLRFAAKQRTFEHRSGNSRTEHLDETTLAPRGQNMDQFCNDFFPSLAFCLDKNWNIGLGVSFDPVAYGPHCRRSGNNEIGGRHPWKNHHFDLCISVTSLRQSL